jgi:hypothetical protein
MIFAFALGSARMFAEAALMITLGFGATGAAAASEPMTGLFVVVRGRKVGPCQRNTAT